MHVLAAGMLQVYVWSDIAVDVEVPEADSKAEQAAEGAQ